MGRNVSKERGEKGPQLVSQLSSRDGRERERRERKGGAESHGETRSSGRGDRGHRGRVAATFRAAEREEERGGKHRHGGERGSPGQAAAGGLGQGFRRVGQEQPLPLGVELQVLSSQAEGALGEEEVCDLPHQSEEYLKWLFLCSQVLGDKQHRENKIFLTAAAAHHGYLPLVKLFGSEED